MNLEINRAQLWWITKALTELTSDEGINKLFDEFPGICQESASDDISDLVSKLVGLDDSEKELNLGDSVPVVGDCPTN